MTLRCSGQQFCRVLGSRSFRVALALAFAAALAPGLRAAEDQPSVLNGGNAARQVILEPAAASRPIGAAMLGVMLSNQQGGVVVPQLHVGGPAQRAGMQAGDQIVEFNGQAIANDQQLIDLIGRCSPNDRVELLVKRRQWTSHITVTLGNRNAVASLPRTQTAARPPVREARTFSYVGSDSQIDFDSALNMYDPYRRALYTAYGP